MEQVDIDDTFENWVITSQGFGIVELEKSISLIKSEFANNGFETKPHGNESVGFDLIDNKKILAKISPVDMKVSVIEIYSNRFSTTNGLKVSLTIEEIEKIYTDFTPKMDSQNGRVYFEPKALQTPNSRFTLYFINKDDSPVWDFIKTPDGDWFKFSPQGKIDKNAIVEVIQICNKQ